MNAPHEKQKQKQQQKQKTHYGKSKCKDRNLDNTSRLIEGLGSQVLSEDIGCLLDASGCHETS
jgi:hypothetical protein